MTQMSHMNSVMCLGYGRAESLAGTAWSTATLRWRARSLMWGTTSSLVNEREAFGEEIASSPCGLLAMTGDY